MYTFKMSEQRKLWNKQYDSEICCTESLYSFFHSSKIANTWWKKVELILVAIVWRSVLSPIYIYLFFGFAARKERLGLHIFQTLIQSYTSSGVSSHLKTCTYIITHIKKLHTPLCCLQITVTLVPYSFYPHT